MTTDNDPIARLATLCEGGDLRFVYVVGVARSNSTVVCKVLGDRLDGAVYEPATPVAVHLHNHYARTILKAYDAARAGKPEREPVLLAIKDLSLFIDDEIFALVLRYAAHIVFTVRDPLTQYPSLVKQFKTEFSLRNRIDALVRWPVETCLLGYYMLTLGTGYFVNASRAFGFSFAKSLLLPIAGWNLTSWRNVVAQFDKARAKLGTARVTVLDAGLMRLLPDAATEELDAIARELRGDRAKTATPVDLAAHSRMFPDSAWADEARRSSAIKPLSGGSTARRPQDAFEEKLLAGFYPDYGHLFFDATNTLLPMARSEAAQPSAAQFSHLLDEDSAQGALGRLLGTRTSGCRDVGDGAARGG